MMNQLLKGPPSCELQSSQMVITMADKSKTYLFRDKAWPYAVYAKLVAPSGEVQWFAVPQQEFCGAPLKMVRVEGGGEARCGRPIEVWSESQQAFRCQECASIHD